MTAYETALFAFAGAVDRALEGPPPKKTEPWPEPDLVPTPGDVLELVADCYHTERIEEVCIPRWKCLDARLHVEGDTILVLLNDHRFRITVTEE
jgi:hypothetical protein